MPVSTEIQVRVAHADVMMDMAFPYSLKYWQRGEKESDPWLQRTGDSGAIFLEEKQSVVIEGDCLHKVSAPEGGKIIVCGNLYSTLDVNGFSEIIITGDVRPDGYIRADDFCHTFIGGRLEGTLQSAGSTKAWIESDLSGVLKSGYPSARIHVGGDYTGHIIPHESASLLSLNVAGFAANESLRKMMDFYYTQFDASIAVSDVPPGLYPLEDSHRRNERGNSYTRWSIQQQREQS
ncbi:MAG: hypothetical protein KDA70_18845 [Planctomycetaceae bacterium]|nr:hypothetical protein [Planctomycetaceae bacterium]MCA9021629.1 hypothetical protein [Planctomycetaceae bacterium]